MVETHQPKWQRAKKPENCAICGKICRFKFYNVQSCEGCKQFFRRVVLKQAQYFCPTEGNCDISIEKCRGCRLDKCLRLGMDPTLVRAESKTSISRIVEALEVRREALLMNLKKSGINDSPAEENKNEESNKAAFEHSALIPEMQKNIFSDFQLDLDKIEYFVKIMAAHKRIAQRCFDLPDEYLNKFSSTEEVLDGQENILSFADCYSPYPENWSDVWIGKLYREMIEIGHHQHPMVKKGHIVHHLMVVGVLKAMPAFGKLKLEDRTILVRELGHQINNLTSAFYAMEMGEWSVTGPRGLSIIGVIMNTCKEIPSVLKIAPKVFVHPIEAFKRIPMLSKEEFALIIAILCSNSAISGLSPHAKDLLYKDQCHYSQLLLKHCQQQAANEIKGAQRYGECLQLIECAFRAVHNFELMNTYREVFYTGRKFYDDISPECIKSLIK